MRKRRLEANPVMLERAKELRRRLTPEERIVWYRLRNRRFQLFKFRRQEVIGNYIVDFVCYEKDLIIELDGGQHNEETHKVYDEQRDGWLRSVGFRILRFWNNLINDEMDAVEEVIWRELNLPFPSPPEESGVREGAYKVIPRKDTPTGGPSSPSPPEGEGQG